MITHTIQHRFTPEDLAAASSAAAVIQQLFGFCTALEAQQRHDLYKLGPGTESFATQMIALAQQHLDLLPRNLDVDDLAARMQTRETLRFYFETLQPLILKMQHSIMLMGAEILRDTLKVYKTLKVNGKEAGLQELLAEIGKRFYTKKPKKKVPENGTAGTDARPAKPGTTRRRAETSDPADTVPTAAPPPSAAPPNPEDSPSKESIRSIPSKKSIPQLPRKISPPGLFEHFSKPYDYFRGLP